MTLARRIEKFSGLSAEVKQQITSTESPQWCVQPGELDDAEGDSESNYLGSETDEGVRARRTFQRMVYDNDA
ncbi:hypothetical protein PCL_10537 [Purpureocillium lilacinum]|uniref:Uncharacterized protein n=1 Tax=Purpureocillium lilacinum TaxID=33203 RepID=A0A2U3DQ36_PURLI|nr:hypothetical protein PCL_10537 [Purpureocillium lilacinum]